MEDLDDCPYEIIDWSKDGTQILIVPKGKDGEHAKWFFLPFREPDTGHTCYDLYASIVNKKLDPFHGLVLAYELGKKRERLNPTIIKEDDNNHESL